MKTLFNKPVNRRGYTLIEALMASAVLMIGIGAAASMSLTMLTQEEINERTVRAMNHLENASTLYRMGIDIDEIDSLLPADPVVSNMVLAEENRDISGGIGTVLVGRMTVVYEPSGAENNWTVGKWTGGDPSFNRTHSIDVFRGNRYTLTP